MKIMWICSRCGRTELEQIFGPMLWRPSEPYGWKRKKSKLMCPDHK